MNLVLISEYYNSILKIYLVLASEIKRMKLPPFE